MKHEQEKAMRKFAERMTAGYQAVHQRDYQEAIESLEPLVPLFHQEDNPNLKLLCYVAIAQIGAKKTERFLETCEELAKYPPSTEQEKALKKRVDEMFDELMNLLNEDDNEK